MEIETHGDAILLERRPLDLGADLLANLDFEIDSGDPVAILIFLFDGQASSAPCRDALDVNDDGSINLSDAIGALRCRFLRGAEPPPPFPGCGQDPTGGDDLDCRAPACGRR